VAWSVTTVTDGICMLKISEIDITNERKEFVKLCAKVFNAQSVILLDTPFNYDNLKSPKGGVDAKS
jgi:hypothetical protein